MTAEKGPVLTGSHFMLGDQACAEGAIYAGCRFFAGYPITPATEIAERMAERLPAIGGQYIQMEDEIGSIAAVLGASVAGVKAMTATSGPGFSLMQENLGLGFMMEVPAVVVNVQRGGPSTGLPTSVGQQDMMQARYGSHGDYSAIAYSPSSPQEAFELTIQAFSTAERLRTPVLVMMDEVVGHMRERVVIPEEGKRTILSRRLPSVPPSEYRPYRVDDDLVPEMALAGGGYSVRMTSLTHDELGRAVTDTATQRVLLPRLLRKVEEHRDVYEQYELRHVKDAEVLLVAYGITGRSATGAVEAARARGIRVGLFRPKSVWPFPAEAFLRAARTVRRVVVAEINMGQIALEVERLIAGRCPVVRVTSPGGEVLSPELILGACGPERGAKVAR
ncbi:MAG TPA: 2-oxoacid:acceptor oxidoreductase subunit alpha [Thermoplasmata archaeon]|nr:2-oxoacid:acceptor oxidoreductase subunit alpha [Thermoplasmata archaeon]